MSAPAADPTPHEPLDEDQSPKQDRKSVWPPRLWCLFFVVISPLLLVAFIIIVVYAILRALVSCVFPFHATRFVLALIFKFIRFARRSTDCSYSEDHQKFFNHEKAHPALVEWYKKHMGWLPQESVKVSESASAEQMSKDNRGLEMMMRILMVDLNILQAFKPKHEIDVWEESLECDGRNFKLRVMRRKGSEDGGTLVYYIHGGGMAVMSAFDRMYSNMGLSLADRGYTVCMPDFTNATHKTHFPCGLNDCYAGLKYVHENKAKLGNFSKVVVAGESGGGNLTLALGMKALGLNTMNMINGLYAMCPMIGGTYNPFPPEFPSIQANDRLGGLEHQGLHNISRLYTQGGHDGMDHKNPLAWPIKADAVHVQGLCPTVIHVNSLDPFRDEDVAMSAKLEKFDVQVRLKEVEGTLHAADTVFPGPMLPELHAEFVQSFDEFCDGLSPV